MNKLWLKGGLIGFLIPLFLLALNTILNSFHSELSGNPIAPFVIFALFLLELPIIFIGRALKLPIETGETAFIMFNFTPLGYILTMVFWAAVGAFFGWIADRKQLNRG